MALRWGLITDKPIAIARSTTVAFPVDRAWISIITGAVHSLECIETPAIRFDTAPDGFMTLIGWSIAGLDSSATESSTSTSIRIRTGLTIITCTHRLTSEFTETVLTCSRRLQTLLRRSTSAGCTVVLGWVRTAAINTGTRVEALP